LLTVGGMSSKLYIAICGDERVVSSRLVIPGSAPPRPA
jgi:hypothetical protein